MDLRSAVALVLVACAGEPPEPEGGGAYVRGRFSNLIGAGVEGAAICVDNDCVETDGQGQFLLEGLPEETDVLVHVDKPDFFPGTLPHFTADSEPPWDKKLLTMNVMEGQAERVGTTLDPTRGHFSFQAHQAHFREGRVDQTAGVTFSLDPDPGFDAYFLTSPLQTADTDLVETTSAGAGGAFNLPPGRYAVTFTGPAGPCSRILSWDFEPGDPVMVEIEAGRGTWIDVLCPAE